MRACPVLVDIVAIDQIQPVCVSAHRGILVDSEPSPHRRFDRITTASHGRM